VHWILKCRQYTCRVQNQHVGLWEKNSQWKDIDSDRWIDT